MNLSPPRERKADEYSDGGSSARSRNNPISVTIKTESSVATMKPVGKLDKEVKKSVLKQAKFGYVLRNTSEGSSPERIREEHEKVSDSMMTCW